MTAGADQILTVAQMRSAEGALIAGGQSVDALMRCAGQGAAEWVWRAGAGRRVTVLCGPGNNGGDGYVIAQTILARGGAVRVIAALAPATPAARHAAQAYTGPRADGDTLPTDDMLVDCLFGSGLTRPLAPAHADLLTRLGASHGATIAIDLPSGVAADTGQWLTDALPACQLTIALGAWKHAHWLMPAAARMGQLRLVEIGVAAVPGAATVVRRPRLQPPVADSHKYRRGLAVVVAGAMPGAALLAGLAAQHAGAGYVKLLSDTVLAAPDDLVVEPGDLARRLGDRRIGAVLIGPGLGRDDAARARLAMALACAAPLVIDADALMLLTPALLAGRTALVIATPHDGEMAALEASFGLDSAGTKVARAAALAAAGAMVVVAKGPGTVIAAPDGRIAIAPPASSWLSTAGTGDVLAGTIVSRLAAGVDPFAAAAQGVWLHGEAARRAPAPFTAGQLARHIAHAYAACL